MLVYLGIFLLDDGNDFEGRHGGRWRWIEVNVLPKDPLELKPPLKFGCA